MCAHSTESVMCACVFLCTEFCIACIFFFLFKQKTAYEMRISDWSSDVCSSDLRDPRPRYERAAQPAHRVRAQHRAIAEADEDDAIEIGERGPSQIGRASCRERVCQYV